MSQRTCPGCGRIVTSERHILDCEWCVDARREIAAAHKFFLDQSIREKLNSDQSKNLKPSEKTV